MIIDHAFNKSRLGEGDPPVGLAPNISLSRRVQLAVLAHIRHNHTRYDQLLRETTYVNARKAVESLCLDILVKWRGDEETGRDQLDEILCEVIVISDSESEESDNEDDEDVSSAASSADESSTGLLGAGAPMAPPVDRSSVPLAANSARGEKLPRASHAPQKVKKTSRKDRRAAKWAQRGFSRYQAAWHQAVERQRLGNGESTSSEGPALDQPASHGAPSWQTGQPSQPSPPDPGTALVRSHADSPYGVHGAYGTALPPVDVSYERGSRVHELHYDNPAASYRMPQEVRLKEHTPSNEPRPIVGSRTVPYGVERVSHHGQDLKDCLLPSIEPASPEPSNLPPRFPISYCRPEPGLPRSADSPVRVAADHRDSTRFVGQMAAAQGYRTAFAEEGFIRLPPRESSRMPAIPASNTEPFIVLREQPTSAARGIAVTTAPSGSGLRYSATWTDGAAGRRGAPILSSGTRPVRIGEDGAVLRSASRPIPIQDYPSPLRQSRSDLPRYADSPIDQRVESLQDDFVEIVRVSNKFPKQHEPRPVPVPTARYDLRSTGPPQGVPDRGYDGVARYDPRSLPMSGQRIERVVATVEVPAVRDRNTAFAARQPDGLQRQERVVGIEYVHPPRRSLETRPYLDRGPFYDTGDIAYRSRSNSVMPAPYPAVPYQQQNPHAAPRRDEVITLD
ncbi:hypothetical protein VTI74DRAFT_4390 [Chaetomium olivicolor]